LLLLEEAWVESLLLVVLLPWARKLSVEPPLLEQASSAAQLAQEQAWIVNLPLGQDLVEALPLL